MASSAQAHIIYPPDTRTVCTRVRILYLCTPLSSRLGRPNSFQISEAREPPPHSNSPNSRNSTNLIHEAYLISSPTLTTHAYSLIPPLTILFTLNPPSCNAAKNTVIAYPGNGGSVWCGGEDAKGGMERRGIGRRTLAGGGAKAKTDKLSLPRKGVVDDVLNN